jgi:hypothetical protein
MVPKTEEFILDVRRAVRLEQKPTVTTDSDMINPDKISQAIQRTTLWLTPKIVETYSREAFAGWAEDLQQDLAEAVESFRNAAQVIPPGKLATPEQFRRGLAAFEGMTAAVRKVVLVEWTQCVEAVVKQIEQWSAEFNWQTRREQKKLTETLLGEYSLPQLSLYAEGHLYVLDPLARFLPSALGAFDLSIQPSFYLTSLYRHLDGSWYVHLDVGEGVKGARKEKLDKDSFRRSIDELRSLL